MREYKIGERFTHEGVELEVVRDQKCLECHFVAGQGCDCEYPSYCEEWNRNDKQGIIYKKAEK